MYDLNERQSLACVCGLIPVYFSKKEIIDEWWDIYLNKTWIQLP